MQTKTKQSKYTKQVRQEEHQANEAIPNQTEKLMSEKTTNADVVEQANGTQQPDSKLPEQQSKQPTENEVVDETVTPPTSVINTESLELATATTLEDDVQIDFDEIDELLADFLATADFVTGSSNHSARTLNAVLAVVNHVNGKRKKVQKAVLQKLAIQVGDFVNVTVKNKQVILLKSLDGEGIQVKTGGYLYNSELVEAITKEFAFDFTNQSTHHLLNVAYKKWNNQVVAIITL